MLQRRIHSHWLFLVLLAACLWCHPSAAGASETSVTSSEAAFELTDLKQQLEKGLRARRDSEFEFIALIVTMVDNNQLPLDLVKSTFLWARKKALKTRYPFPYFERGLRVRAAKQGIDIP